MNSEEIRRIVREEVASSSTDREVAAVYRERLRESEETDAVVHVVQKRRGLR